MQLFPAAGYSELFDREMYIGFGIELAERELNRCGARFRPEALIT